MSSIFSKIARGEISSYKVAENDNFFAFLDINPLVKGHVLVIPKKEIDYFFDIADDDLGCMMVFVKKVANAIKKTVSCKRIGLAVVGFDVPHAHIHLVPLQDIQDIDFNRKRVNLLPEEFLDIADRISKNM